MSNASGTNVWVFSRSSIIIAIRVFACNFHILRCSWHHSSCSCTVSCNSLLYNYKLWTWNILKGLVLELTHTLMPIIFCPCKLDGFHLLKSYLGSLENIMNDFGLLKLQLIQLIYLGSATAHHILNGGHFEKVICAHLLINIKPYIKLS